MKPLTVGLPFLLKLMSLRPDHRVSELRNRLRFERRKKSRRSGGHNYYWFMERHAPLLIKGESDFQRIDEEINAMKREKQRTYNRNALDSFWSMWEFSNVVLIPLPEAVFVSDFGMLHVTMAPVFAYEMNGQKYCLYLWTRLKPDLLAATARLGIYFSNRELPAFLAHVYDLDRKVKYVEPLDWQQGEIRLGRELRSIESDWIKLNQDAEKGSGKDDRPTDEGPKPLGPGR